MVVALLALVGSAPFLFETNEGELDDFIDNSIDLGGAEPNPGEQSVYSTGLFSAQACGPSLEVAPKATGGTESVPELAEDVERLRGLKFETEPTVEFMTGDALAEHVRVRSQEELEQDQVDIEVGALKKIGVVPENFDFDEFLEASSQQILGLYEQDTERLLVGETGPIDPAAQVIVAHELDHALTDQVLGLPPFEFDADRADAQVAESALVEGDATLLMQHYGVTEFPDDIQEILLDSGTADQAESFAQIPYFFQRSAAFPYNEGYLFVCELYADGGWKAVDRAYGSPPTATLEILFPGIYGEIEFQKPVRIGTPGEGWTKEYEAELGATDLQWMFEAPGGELSGDVAEAANQVSRWRGGRFHIWKNGPELTVAMSVVEGSDLSGSDSSTLCHRMVRWHTESFPDASFLDGRGTKGAWLYKDDVAIVDCEGTQVRYVVAPDIQTALRVARF